jgi:hemoglobin-like flavoprotein
MTTTEITLVKNAFEKLGPISEQAAALFYARLFELDPSFRRLLRGNMEAQQRKFLEMITLAVNSLDRPDEIAATLRPLGVQHARAGVRPEHYSAVGTALLWTLEKTLAADFSPAVKSAWSAAYSLFSNFLLEGQRSGTVAA